MSIATNNYILIETIQPAKKKGSLFLPDQAIDTPRWGRVLDVGEGIYDYYGNMFPPNVAIGDYVFFMRHGPEKTDYSDMGLPPNLYVISEGDIYIKMKHRKDEIEPMGNYVHVRPLDDTVQKVTPGGIVLPDQVVERPCKGVVVSVGRGQRLAGGEYKRPPLSPGDIVRYRNHSAFVINFADLDDRDEELVIPYGDILLREVPDFAETLKKRIDNLNALEQGDDE